MAQAHGRRRGRGRQRTAARAARCRGCPSAWHRRIGHSGCPSAVRSRRLCIEPPSCAGQHELSPGNTSRPVHAKAGRSPDRRTAAFAASAQGFQKREAEAARLCFSQTALCTSGHQHHILAARAHHSRARRHAACRASGCARSGSCARVSRQTWTATCVRAAVGAKPKLRGAAGRRVLESHLLLPDDEEPLRRLLRPRPWLRLRERLRLLDLLRLGLRSRASAVPLCSPAGAASSSGAASAGASSFSCTSSEITAASGASAPSSAAGSSAAGTSDMPACARAAPAASSESSLPQQPTKTRRGLALLCAFLRPLNYRYLERPGWREG
jgi:hypothetical protein